MTYVELHTRSALSLLGGASLPEQLLDRAAQLGYPGVALTDEMDMGGVVRFAEHAREIGVDGILGAQIVLAAGHRPPIPDSGANLVLLAETEVGYRNICRLITRARMQCPRDRARVDPAWLEAHLDGVVVLDGGFDGPVTRWLRAGQPKKAMKAARWLAATVPRHQCFFEISSHRTHEERRLNAQIDALGEELGVARVLTGDVRFATPEEKPIYDVLTCVRHRIRLADAGTRLLPNREWHLQPLEVLRRRWRDRPELLARTVELGQRLAFRFDALNPRLPEFPRDDRFPDDDALLAHLVWEGARLRYPEMTPQHRRQIEHELAMIRKKQMAGYFLISWDIARFCRSQGILAQGRGSAANSAVCYCLRITAVDPIGMDLLFERFLSEGREEYPDIDIDIAHEWREEVIQYVYERYGRERAGMVCEQIRYRGRSAVRDAAWALGFEQEQINRLAGQVGRYDTDVEAGRRLAEEGASAAGVSRDDPRLPLLGRLVAGLLGIPRHRSIHVGGMVLTADPLGEIVPIEPASMPDRTVIQWEKDDLPYSGLAKFDLLGLGMLSLLQKALGHLSEERGEPFDLAHVPPDDPVVYDALCKADTVGVFQIESRAQMNTLPRLKPRCFYDLVVEIALIRPGPIQGKMVHPYLRRRDGREPVEYLHPDLEPILKRTLGVPIFQEQVMKIAITLADFSPSQADELRRAMGFRRYSPRMGRLEGALHEGMRARGIEKGVRDQIVAFLTAFGNYGFPESHSASFALLAYASSWLKVYHAPLFAACLINSQPMGFYSNASIVQDARLHGVECRPPDLQRSDWDCTLEPANPPACGDSTSLEGRDRAQPKPRDEGSLPQAPWPHALRIGLRCVDNLGKASREKLERARALGPFRSIRDAVVRTGLSSQALAALAQAGAFDSFLGAEGDLGRRRKALWRVLREGRIPAHGLDRFGRPEQAPVDFEPLSRHELIVQDLIHTGLCTHGHPMETLRAGLEARGIRSARALKAVRNGRWVKVAGMVTVRQRPGTAKGFLFLTLEDETGMMNIIVAPQVFDRYRKPLLTLSFLEIHGVAQVEGEGVQIKARHFYPLDGQGARVPSRDFH